MKPSNYKVIETLLKDGMTVDRVARAAKDTGMFISKDEIKMIKSCLTGKAFKVSNKSVYAKRNEIAEHIYSVEECRHIARRMQNGETGSDILEDYPELTYRQTYHIKERY